MHHTFLKRSEQTVLAFLLFAALAAITGYWGLRIWHRRDLVEFETSPRLEATFCVDINRADWPELMQLPGIGKKTARSIIEARETGGPFLNLDDLEKRVRGVGPRMTAEITPFVLLPQITSTPRNDSQP